MIRRCADRDFEAIWTIINDGAQAYRGIIPADRWTEPSMSREQLEDEIAEGVVFWGYEENGALVGVMGIQRVQDVTLIRHAYVRSSNQKGGIGGQLLSHLRDLASSPAFNKLVPRRRAASSNTTGLCPNARSKRPWCWATRSGGKRSADASRFLAACYGGRRCAA